MTNSRCVRSHVRHMSRNTKQSRKRTALVKKYKYGLICEPFPMLFFFSRAVFPNICKRLFLVLISDSAIRRARNSETGLSMG